MKSRKTDPNLKLPEKTVLQLKKINARLLKYGFDNIKVINSVAVDELEANTKKMSGKEAFAYLVSRTYGLQRRGIVKVNARSIGNPDDL